MSEHVADGALPQVGDQRHELLVQAAAREALAAGNGVELGVDTGGHVERCDRQAGVDAAVAALVRAGKF